MLDERLMEDIYAVAEKMDSGKRLTREEQLLYDDIQEDGDAYRIFCLYTALMDLPTVCGDVSGRGRRAVRADRESISRRVKERRSVQNPER